MINDVPNAVARSTRAWIETGNWRLKKSNIVVARSTRAWIETETKRLSEWRTLVARSTRAWIETRNKNTRRCCRVVARSTRAWIETSRRRGFDGLRQSHALRVRGLKQEIKIPGVVAGYRRTLYACVD